MGSGPAHVVQRPPCGTFAATRPAVLARRKRRAHLEGRGRHASPECPGIGLAEWHRMKTITKQDRKEIDPKPRPAPSEKRRIPRLPSIRTNVRAGFHSDPCEGGEIKRP